MTNTEAPAGTAQAEATKTLSVNGAFEIRLDLGPVSHEITLTELEAKLPAIIKGLAEQVRIQWPEAKTSVRFADSRRGLWSQGLLLMHLEKCMKAQVDQYTSNVDLGLGAAASCSLRNCASSAEIS